MIDNFLNVTAKAKAGKTAGHGRWFHSLLINEGAKKSQVAFQIVSKNEKIENSFDILSYHQDRIDLSYFFPLPFAILDSRKILAKLETCPIKYPNFHFYEGGFREFLLTMLLLGKNPNAVAIFNFNLAEPWNELLNNKGVMAKAIRGSIQSLASWAGSRIFYFSESDTMQQLLKSSLNISSENYPLFSCMPYEILAVRAPKEIDITYFPFSVNELDFCLSLHAKVTLERPGTKGRIVMRWGGRVDSMRHAKIKNLELALVSGALDEDKYRDVYVQTKIVFLPYFGEYYAYSSSGRLLDAIQGGAWVMAPEGSAQAGFILRHGLGKVCTLNYGVAAQQVLGLLQVATTQKPHLDVSVSRSFRVLEETLKKIRSNQFQGQRKVPKLNLLFASFAIFGTSKGHMNSVLYQSIMPKKIIETISMIRKKASER